MKLLPLYRFYLPFRCEEPVGEHCSRQWCSTQSHPGIFKTPIHQAAQMGSFQCLKMFVRHSPSSMIARDAYKRTPSNYASKYKNFECWKLLIASQFVHSRINGFSLASHARIMKWCSAAKERVSYFKGEDTKHSLLLHSTIGKENNTYLGNEITVAGFNHGKSIKKCPCNHEPIKPLPRRNTNHKFEVKFPDEGHDFSHKETLSRRKSQAIKPDSKAKPILKDSPTKSLKTTTAIRNNRQERGKSLDLNNAKFNFPKTETQRNESNKKLPMIRKYKTLPNIVAETNSPKQKSIIKDSTNKTEHISNYDKDEVFSESESVLNTSLPQLQMRHLKERLSTRRSSSLSNLAFLQQEQQNVHNIILETTGMSSKDLANKCLQLGESFTGRSWMRQFRIAMNSSTNRIKRGRPKTSALH